METSSLLLSIWLSLRFPYGSKIPKKLLSAFKTVKAVYESGEQDLKTLDISLPDKKKILDKNTDAAKKIEDDCRAKGIRILTVEDTSYPSLLLQTVSPPLVLYYKGTVPDWNRRPCFAVVGTRAMSDYGAASAADICFDLGRMDCITVSGMALGIDGMAAAATLEAGGTTVAVLGSGLDVIYPAAHSFLYETILKNGGIVLSEYPPGSRPERYHFPVRNRIISGIARGIIMVEGNANSGALITAEIGLREGRAVFAVPGKIGEKNQEGALLLLKSGASAITCADDIYDRFKEEYVGKLNGFSLLTPRKIFFKSIMAKYRITGGYAKHESALGESGYIREPAFRKTLSVASAKPSIWEKTIKMAKELVKKDEKATLEEETVPPCGMNDKEKLVYRAMPDNEECYVKDISVEGLSEKDISVILTFMELEGYVSALPGGRYMKHPQN